LAYQGDRIVSDIKSSLGRLQNNNIQKENSSCINPPKLTWVQKIQGPMLVVVDYTISPVLDSGLYVTTGAYKLASAIGNSVLSGISTTASALASLTSSKTTFYNLNNLAINNPSSVIVADDQLAEIDQNMNTSPEPVPENLKPATIPKPQTETTPPPKMQVKTNTTFVAVASVPQTKFLRSGVIITPSTETSLDQGGEDLPAQTEGGNSEPNPPAEEEIIPPVEEVSSVDKISPVITILGNDSETMVVGSVYIDAGATAFDEVDGDITVNIITVNLVDTAVPGTYTVTYNVSDAKGNAAMQMTRTVNVVIPGPAQLLGHMIYGAFYFDNPTILNNYTKIIYKGHYPDISFVYSGLTLPIELVSVQTVGCGWICGSKNGEYYWFDLDSDEGHYIFEVHRNGPSGLMDWEVIDPFSKVILSSSKEILSFNFEYLNPEVFGVIDQNNHTINLSVPFGTDVTKLMPGILLSDTTASVAPLEYVPRDFTNPVTYIVTAQDYSTQTYTVNVTIESDTNPPL
jgi:hypothetical protein